jgi:hypothetical protein
VQLTQFPGLDPAADFGAGKGTVVPRCSECDAGVRRLVPRSTARWPRAKVRYLVEEMPPHERYPSWTDRYGAEAIVGRRDQGVAQGHSRRCSNRFAPRARADLSRRIQPYDPDQDEEALP